MLICISKSVNTPGYRIAVLLKEGVLTKPQDKKRIYHYKSTEKLLAKANQKR